MAVIRRGSIDPPIFFYLNFLKFFSIIYIEKIEKRKYEMASLWGKIIMFKGCWLDDHTFVCTSMDRDGVVSWWKLTTVLPKDEDGTVKINPLNGEGFDLETIDPHNFEWNGYKVSLKLDF